MQLHTVYSDGTWTPEQLVDCLVSERFGLAAITDHDRVDTVASLQQLAAEKRLPVLAAVEMSTSWRGEPTDVLYYGFDPEKNELHDLAQDIAHRQRENTKEVYENLLRQGYTFAQQQGSVKEVGDEPEQPDELVALLEKPGAQQPHELVTYFKSLRPRYQTAILSNGIPGARAIEQERFHFTEMTDLIIYSYEEKTAKPERRIFEITCERLGVQPEEVIFLDDIKKTVTAARDFGIHAILFQKTAQAIADVQATLGAHSSTN